MIRGDNDPIIIGENSNVQDGAVLHTDVGQPLTIGANCTIGPGIELGAFCMAGMGSVVTRSLPSHALALGNPARVVGAVCRCGERVATFAPGEAVAAAQYSCAACGRSVPFGS